MRARALVYRAGLTWPKLLHIIDNAPEFDDATCRDESGTLYLPYYGLSIGLFRIRNDFYHAQIIENGMPREAILQSERSEAFLAEMNRPSNVRTSRVAMRLREAVGECVDVCLPLSQAIRIPEDMIIGGLNDDSPRVNDDGATGSVDSVMSPVGFTLNGINCPIVSNTSGEKIICVLHDKGQDLLQNSVHVMHSVKAEMGDFTHHNDWPDAWLQSQFKKLEGL